MRSPAGRLRVLALAAWCAAAAACTAARPGPPSRAAAPERPSPLEQLRRDLRAVVTDPATDHAVWAVAVASLETGETLYSLNAFTHLVPASSLKLVTAAVAAARLGWEYRFETRLVAMGPIADGRLQGDLLIAGTGDPTINPRHPDRWVAFDDWARRLRKAGIRYIDGNLIGDGRAFAPPAWGAGWEWDDLRFGYAAQVSALQFNENQVAVTAGPGMTPGLPAVVAVSPPDSGLYVANQAVTGAPGSAAELELRRVPGSAFADLIGSIPLDAEPRTVIASVEQPTTFYLAALEAALARNDVFVKGRALDASELIPRPDPAAGRTILVDRSPPLGEIVDVVLKWSRNLYAESLLRALDLSGRPATPERGLARVRETLAQWGIPPDRYVMRDGSGLSRYNFASADMLVALLTHAWRDPAIGDRFVEALPEAGRSGTLADRLKGTPAEGRIRAKTGTMTHVRSLAGYLRTRDGEPLVFAILANNHRVPAAEIDRRVDRILLRLVEFSRRQSVSVHDAAEAAPRVWPGRSLPGGACARPGPRERRGSVAAASCGASRHGS